MAAHPCAHSRWEAHCRTTIPGGVRICGWFRCRDCGAIQDAHTKAIVLPLQRSKP